MDVPAVQRVSALLGIASAVEAGVGIAVLPDFVALARGLTVLDVGATLPAVTVYALFRTEYRGSPRVEVLVSHLKQTVPLDTAPSYT